MDKQELTDALQALDIKLPSSCDVLVVGGAAMILYFGASRATNDIDVLLLRGEIAELRLAIKEVAQDRGLAEDWMSDAAKGFADILPRDFYHRLTPLDLGLGRLHLYVLGLPE